MYLTAKQVKNKYSITSQTLHNWRHSDKIQYIKLPSGRYMYLPIEEIASAKKMNVFYARVSNTKQKDDLIRQQQILRQFMATNGVIIDEEFSDIASGMNESRKEFNRLLTLCLDGKIDTVYITYKDRFTRFGYGYLESILSKVGTKIVIINTTKEEEFQQELTQDLVSIIHHFSMKMYSNRRKILKEMEKEITKDINT